MNTLTAVARRTALALAALLVALPSGVVGCGGAAPSGTVRDGGGADQAVACTGVNCLCASDVDCPAGNKCLVAARTCVVCITDGDCAAGLTCNPASHTCLPGCSAQHGCGDAGY